MQFRSMNQVLVVEWIVNSKDWKTAKKIQRSKVIKASWGWSWKKIVWFACCGKSIMRQFDCLITMNTSGKETMAVLRKPSLVFLPLMSSSNSTQTSCLQWVNLWNCQGKRNQNKFSSSLRSDLPSPVEFGAKGEFESTATICCMFFLTGFHVDRTRWTKKWNTQRTKTTV